MRNRKRDIIAYMRFALATLLAFMGISAHACATKLTVVRYEVAAELTRPLRLVQLTDLHSHVFGADNGDLVELIARQQPDLILMTGDMIDRQDENAGITCALIRQLQQIAPVYYGYGNHEISWISRTGLDLEGELTEAGAIVLDSSYQDISVDGQPLRIGGFHGYYRYPGMMSSVTKSSKEQAEFFDAFEDTDRYQILLGHIPTPWLDWGKIDGFAVDLVLSGHYHGGQVRIPGIGGVFAPYIGLFPAYTQGLYAGETATCILSSGLGSSPGIPRINNLPQIVVVDLTPKNT